jgi:hypothetical protein
MRRRPSARAIRTVLLALLLALPASVAAQDGGSRRVAIDTVIGVQDVFAETRDWPTVLMFDPFISAEVHRHTQVAVRPKFWRLNGEWALVLDQASVQHEFRRGSNWRIEAGRFPSPVGLGMTQNRANVNPSVYWWHRPYYMPLPSLGSREPMVALVSATYPTGVLVSTSGDAWDARAALVDTAPVQFWQDEAARTDARVNAVVGGGFRPRQGLRLGAATAWGDLTRGAGGQYRMLNVEGEYAFGYTEMSGEWTLDRFDLATGRHTAWGWTLQATQTMTPRLFAHSRATVMGAPQVKDNGASIRRSFRSIDTTVGYRLDAELTLRVGYSALRSFTAARTDHQAGLSLVWSRRWW